jgi:hypothetical protein
MEKVEKPILVRIGNSRPSRVPQISRFRTNLCDRGHILGYKLPLHFRRAVRPYRRLT